MHLRGCLARANGPAWFAGPHGLRATWRIILFLILVILQLTILASATIHALRHLFPHEDASAAFTPGVVSLNELLLVLPVLGGTAAMAYLEDARFLSYGLAGPRKLSNLLTGFTIGFAGLSLLVAALIATGSGSISGGGFGPFADIRFGLEWCFISLLIGFTEELAFRGYIFSTIMHGAGFRWATLVTSVIFAASHGHNAGETFIGLVLTFEAGLLFCFTIYLTKSLWLAIGLHGAWDYAENYVYGTRDSGTLCYGTLLKLTPHGNVYLSGGLTGPEGSIFALLMVGLMGLAVFACRRRAT